MDDELTMEEEQRMGQLQQERLMSDQSDTETPQAQSKQRIDNITAIFMIVVALCYDGVQVFLEWIVIGVAVNWILDIWAWLTFYVWFKMKNVSFANPKRALSLNGGFLLEFIPGLDELPCWTGAVIIMVLSVIAEDKLAKISPAAGKALSAATGKK